jgi:hypothetical protein
VSRRTDGELVVLIPLAAGVLELCGRGEGKRTLVALVTTGIVVATVGALSLNETVSKEKLVVLAVGLVGGLELEVTVGVNVLVNVLGDPALSAQASGNLERRRRNTHSVCSGHDVRPHWSKPISNHLLVSNSYTVV